MISVTSIAARGSDTIVTLSDGRVFGPGALSQLHLSYLVPAIDGTYLGAGVPPSGPAGAAAARGAAAATAEAGALVAIAVTSEEPASPFTPWSAGGNPAHAFAAAVPYLVQVDFQNGYCGSTNEWRVGICRGEDVLSSTEQALVRSVALQAMRDAYQGYDVTFTTANPSAQRRIRLLETVHPDVPHGEIALGFTPQRSLVSEVYFPNVWTTLMSVVGCPTLDSACLQTKQFSREDVLRAFGRGIGNTASHELGHQPPYYFTADLTRDKCLDCYDSARGTSRAHFFGQLRWSDFAKNKMRFLVSNK